jgi:ribonucleoside-diphosphate reductase alpha chain
VASERRRLPDERKSVCKAFRVPRQPKTCEHCGKLIKRGPLKMWVHVGLYEDGRPGELFIKADQEGSLARGALDAVAMSLSMAWQYGVPFEASVQKLMGMRFEPQGATGDAKYSIVSSPLDYVARWLLDKFGRKDGDIGG